MAMGISRSMSNKEQGCLEFREEVEDEEEREEIFSIPFSEVEDWSREGEFETITKGWSSLFFLV